MTLKGDRWEGHAASSPANVTTSYYFHPGSMGLNGVTEAASGGIYRDIIFKGFEFQGIDTEARLLEVFASFLDGEDKRIFSRGAGTASFYGNGIGCNLHRSIHPMHTELTDLRSIRVDIQNGNASATKLFFFWYEFEPIK